MNIEHWHYFLDVAKTKSITRAAKLNFISPQGMSRAMNELEKELGCELLIRYPNKLALSPVGEELVPKAAEIIDGYAEMLEFAAAKSRVLHAGGGRSVQLECQNIAMLAFLTQEAKIISSNRVTCVFASLRTPRSVAISLPSAQVRPMKSALPSSASLASSTKSAPVSGASTTWRPRASSTGPT